MKKLFKSAAIVAASLLLAVNFISCDKDPQPTTEETNKAQKEAIVKQYLNHTVYPTYAPDLRPIGRKDRRFGREP